jgi:RNA polymerase sigma-70 factor (ECF subfamily)
MVCERQFDQVSALESRDMLRRLEDAVGKLKPKTREIFLARRIHELTYAEIAMRTGLGVKRVEKHCITEDDVRKRHLLPRRG